MAGDATIDHEFVSQETIQIITIAIDRQCHPMQQKMFRHLNVVGRIIHDSMERKELCRLWEHTFPHSELGCIEIG